MVLPHQLEETKQWCALGERVGVCMELEGLLRVEKRRKVMREAQAQLPQYGARKAG